MDPYKLSVKIGDHEFHGEGPAETVSRDFEQWKELIGFQAKPATHKNGFGADPGTPADTGKPHNVEIDAAKLARVFLQDDRRDLVTVRMLPRSEERDADTLLLILLGYKSLKNEEEVLVTQVKPALRQSGCMIERVDSVANKYIAAGYINKGGLAKGGRYSLTNAGLDKARSVLDSLFA